MDVLILPCLEDNYSFLLRYGLRDDLYGGIAIDVPDAPLMLEFAAKHKCQIKYILNTHHHYDHVMGNKELEAKLGPMIIGPKYETDKICGITRQVGDGDKFKLGNLDIEVFHVPGHTDGMVNYYFPGLGILFTADCIFSVGCGRVASDCTYEQMWKSLTTLRKLPDDTTIYFAHEYTQKNIDFAMTVMKSTEKLLEYKEQVDFLRKQNLPTVPTTMKLEKLINPFLRCDLDDFNGIDTNLSALEKFTALRKLKDSF